eukprot:830487-Pyramimonas_sp.AAC.1
MFRHQAAQLVRLQAAPGTWVTLPERDLLLQLGSSPGTGSPSCRPGSYSRSPGRWRSSRSSK